MTVLVDTSQPELWSEAHERIFFPIGVRLAAPQLEARRIAEHRIGPVGAYRVTSDASVVRRSTRGIAALDPEQFLVATALRGTQRIEQGGRQIVFAPGELSSWDSSHPFSVTHLDAFDLLLMVVPRALLGPRRDAICARTAARLDGALAGPFFTQVWSALDGGGVASPEDVAEAIVALVRALHPAAHEDVRLPGGALLPQIKAYIDAHLGDLGLGPERIARAHFISTRYLHKLFEGEGVSDWIRRRRLEMCRRDLLATQDPISLIARRWGLVNPAHFSRVFRAAYGLTPSELRALADNGSARGD
jgi:AraC-like DNA-binding protein